MSYYPIWCQHITNYNEPMATKNSRCPSSLKSYYKLKCIKKPITLEHKLGQLVTCISSLRDWYYVINVTLIRTMSYYPIWCQHITNWPNEGKIKTFWGSLYIECNYVIKSICFFKLEISKLSASTIIQYFSFFWINYF
jgi:hypothetical protein